MICYEIVPVPRELAAQIMIHGWVMEWFPILIDQGFPVAFSLKFTQVMAAWMVSYLGDLACQQRRGLH
jgi:hypothetical protein